MFLILYPICFSLLKAVGDLLPCGAGLTPMVALSSGQSAPRPLTARTKLPLSHAAPPKQPTSTGSQRVECGHLTFLCVCYVNVLCKYLHPLFTAAEQPSVSELQSFFGTSTLLSFILQTAKVTLIDCERLKGLLWTQVTLLNHITSIKNINEKDICLISARNKQTV